MSDAKSSLNWCRKPFYTSHLLFHHSGGFHFRFQIRLLLQEILLHVQKKILFLLGS